MAANVSADAHLKIGFIAGTTGPYGPWGVTGLKAATMAVDEINAQGGVNGSAIEMVVADNKSTAEGSIIAWKRVVDVENSTVVVGVESDGGLALLDEAASAQIPIICPACGASKLAELGGDYVFRITGGDNDLGVIMAQNALESTKTVAILTQLGFDATEGITDVFIKAFEKGGGTVAEDIRFAGEAASFRGEIQKAIGAADTIVVATMLDVGTRLFTEVSRRNYDAKFYVIPELVVDEIAGLGGGALEGKVFGVSPSYDYSDPAFQRFHKAFVDRAGYEPTAGMYEANYYDQIILVALAAEAGGANDGVTVRNNLVNVANAPGTRVTTFEEGVAELRKGNDIEFHGASGTIDFNDKGNVASIYGVVSPKDGSWVEVQSVQLDASLR
jgi:ABC-type branched-subunit amino acid transport system substrate-binding protein